MSVMPTAVLLRPSVLKLGKQWGIMAAPKQYSSTYTRSSVERKHSEMIDDGALPAACTVAVPPWRGSWADMGSTVPLGTPGSVAVVVQ